MADYLCRVRLDRAGMEYKENNKLGLKDENPVETKNFYLKLSDDEKEGFIKIGDFFNLLNVDNTYAERVLRNLMKKMEATEIINEGEPGTEIPDPCLCPICGEYGKNVYVSTHVLPGDKTKKTKDGYPIYNVADHIKPCNHPDCVIGVYCDGGDEDIYGGGESIKDTHMYHYHKIATGGEEGGHYPVEEKIINISNVIDYNEAFRKKSIIGKFSEYCNTLDMKNVDEKLNSSFKNYLNDNSFMDYISFRYDVHEDNGGHTLRLKVEITECKNFLKRDYDSLELLNLNVTRFLTYTDLIEGFATEDDLYDIGSLKSLAVSFTTQTDTAKQDTMLNLNLKEIKANENGEYEYILEKQSEKVTINFTVPEKHTEVTKILLGDKEIDKSLRKLEDVSTAIVVKIHTKEIVNVAEGELKPESESKPEDIKEATHIISFGING